MVRNFSIGHSFNGGDLVSILPSIKRLSLQHGVKADIYQRLNLPAYYFDDASHPVKDAGGRQVCMNGAMFSMMKPLVEYQNYVNFFMEWEGEQVDFNIDQTRHSAQLPLTGGSLPHLPSLIFPQLHPDLNQSWLEAPVLPKSGKIVINRTNRYTNPYIDFYFLKKYENDIVFVGTVDEYLAFTNKWKLNVPRETVDDFLHLASVIQASRFFIGNQSMCHWIAEGLKVPRLLEICQHFPNTWPMGRDGRCYIAQNALEYYFEEFYNKTV